METIFKVDHISFSHPIPGGEPQLALKDLSFQILQGEYVAIVGANGSGKTTLARHLNALHIPDQGQVLIHNLNTSDKSNFLAIHQRIGMVFQHPQEQMIATTVEEDVAFGPENLGLPTSEIRERVKSALQSVNMWEYRARAPHQLSAGQMQRVALAGILSMQPSCIIFDEVTAMLDPAGRQDVLNSIKLLHKMGITIITISHFMEEAVEAERILGLSNGQLIFDGPPGELFSNDRLLESLNLTKPRILTFAQQLSKWIPELQNPMTLSEFELQLKLLENHVSFNQLNQNNNKTYKTTPLVEVNDLSFTYLMNTPLAQPALHDITFNIPENSLHGLIGSTGSGKSTLLQHFNGLYNAQQGSLRVGPFTINQGTDVIALRRYAGIVFQNPNYQLFEQFVGDEIAYGLKLIGIRGSELRQRVREAMTLVGLDFDTFKDRMTFALSGGERRKVALASTLVLDPTLLLLDEPTAGLDPFARQDILNKMKLMHKKGKTLVVSSHQLEDLALLTDRVTLLSQGRLVSSQESNVLLSNHHLLQENLMIAPIAAQMTSILREKGWHLPDNIINSQQLISNFEQKFEIAHG
jgi:energy-coupling factor transport system ATP-binding protein